MHQRNKELIFGNFKLKFFALFFVFIVAILVYLFSIGMFRDWQIQFSYYNMTVIGDGVSNVVIPFTILKGNEQPITVPVQVQAITNIGSVKTNCSAPSVCTTIFTAPKTSKQEYANISINVGGVNGGVTKVVKIEVLPDATTSLNITPIINGSTVDTPITLYLSDNNDLYYGNNYIYQRINNITIAVRALGEDGTPVPSGTLIHFSTTAGTLSSTSCIVTGNNGVCSIIYTPPTKLEQINLTVYSYNVKNSIIINVTKPPFGYTGYSILNDSLELVPHSELCEGILCIAYNFSLNGSIKILLQSLDVLKEPIPNVFYNTEFLVNLGYFSYPAYILRSSCITSANGSCTVQFTENLHNLWDNETDIFGYPSFNPQYRFVIEYSNGYNATLFTLSCGNGITCINATT